MIRQGFGMRMASPRLWLAAVALLSACTAARVVTHSVDSTLSAAPAGVYSLDPNHWSITFDVDHLKYSRVVMRFNRAKATLQLDAAAPEQSSVKVEIDAASLDTNDKTLDKLVTSSALIDAANYPTIRFDSTRFETTGPSTAKLTGTLTIHGASTPVTLDVTFNGAAPNPLTREPTAGFSATGTFNRSSLGLAKWYPAVGDDVQVRIQAEFVQHRPGTGDAPPPAGDSASGAKGE
ncbi:Protein YceI [Pararobbsia alpina]|uniref:Protein YceI n=2 Tax=Pararobbsia alpina TaxID=621374 RepID=A0A6S7B8X8_9BURK|nr:Protein YceI [Pararobbsia alpina]